MKTILNISSIKELPINFSWCSETKTVGDLAFILFALATGDWNKVHINPFTAWRYRSNLKGLTCCGDFVLGLTKPGIHKILRFIDDTEIIAIGYSKVEFKRPLHLGGEYYYSYTLIQRVFEENRAYCTWFIEVKNSKNKPLMSATWNMFYTPVERRTFIFPIINAVKQEWFMYACVSVFAMLLFFFCLQCKLPALGP